MSDPSIGARMIEVDHDPFASPALSRVVPTTEAQREIWLADRLGTEASLAYNESVSLTIAGALNAQALQQALLALGDRHEALRATLSDDGLSLLIAPHADLPLRRVEAGNSATALDALRAEAVTLPFDLERGPLLRAVLARVAPTRHELLLTGHHIVCDGWSFGVLAGELMALYDAIAGGRLDAGLPPADSFGDHALAQAGAEHQAAAESDARWWVQQYDGAIPVLSLPTDRPRPLPRGFASLREDLLVDATLADGVRRLGAQHGASLFVTLIAIFGGMVARLAGQDDVVVGVPAAGQAASGRPRLVGHCVQLLPIRLAMDLAQPFPALLESTRGRVLDAYEHAACSFGQWLKKLQLQRDPARPALVSVLFNLDQAVRVDELSVAGLEVALSSNPRRFENFDLFLNASQTDGAIVLECQYNCGLFDADTVRRWLQLYRQALERLVAEPGQSAVRAFAPGATDLALLARFNPPPSDYPRSLRIDTLIARQAAITPGATAIVAGERALSYRELDNRADVLALTLRDRGVAAGDLVGLCCGRNEHMPVALLGILRAGAGYVPLDPSLPAARLAEMASDAGLHHIVGDRSVDASRAALQLPWLWVDELAGRAATAAPATGSADDVAYVIYTSGSTGRPKGVRVAHRSVVNLLHSVAREPGMTADNVVLAVTTLSFDIAASELILPLTVGARVVVADRSQAADGDRLKALIEQQGVDFIDATPSTWRLLLAAGWTGGRHVKAICTGEPLPPDLARELLPRVGELWNGYGPTETTVWSSFHRLHAAPGPGTVPIGRPLANTQIHVVDAQLQPLPVGVVGELMIGGEGVALGYHGQPALTDERFLPDPTRPGARWYRTGDRGRWRADGLLECLGRSDQQVKVRGYRIELGEIEVHLGRHPDVARALVVTREDAPGDLRLVGYVVSRGPVLDTAALREFLRLSLPGYMIPSHVLQLAAIPQLPNGKINRAGLPRPESGPLTVAGHTTPCTPREAQVLAAMESVLNLPGLGPNDDFFDFGGHSLLAAQLAAQLSRELGQTLPMRTVFEAPTAQALAKAIDAAPVEAEGRRFGGAPEAIEHRADRRKAPLTLMQERIRFMEQMHPGRVVYNTPSAHRLRGPFDRVAFAAALGQLVQRQPALRTAIVLDETGPVQWLREDVELALPFDDLSDWPAASRETELMRRLDRLIDLPIAIDQAPLARAALFRLAADEHVFLFMAHHIVWDGWSFDLLYQEMASLYAAALAGVAASLPAPAVTTLDFAFWHRQWLEGDACRAQLQYWKQRYAAIEAPRAMPTDHPRRSGGASGLSGRGAVEWVHVDKALTEDLRALARRSGATLNMLVLSIYAAMMGQALASASLVIGIPVRGRPGAEVDNVMGFFNNLVPAHFRVDPALPLGQWTQAVRHELLDALAHQEVPFERLAGEPEIAVHAQRAGLYQCLFSFQDARARQRRWGPLEHSSVLVMQKGATEDLALWLMEVPDGLEGGINYNADLFDAATASLFGRRLLALLRRAVEHPALTLGELLSAPGDDHTSFVAWAQARQDIGNAAPSARAPAVVRLTGEQAQLAAIWAQLLGIEAGQIGAEDNFFDLGGGSLLVMQAAAIAERELGLRVDPRRYVSESLRQLAARSAATFPAAAEARAAPRSWVARVFGRTGQRG